MKKSNFVKNCCILFILFLNLPNLHSINRRTLPFDWDNATVYFMLTDRFNNGDSSNDLAYGRQRTSPNSELDFQGGDLKGVTQKINSGYFDELGVSVLWITAPYEQMHGPVGKENAWAFHGYWTKDWTQMDDNFGSEQDLRDMIDAAHDHGMRVILDVVLNHTGYPTSWDDAWPDSWVRNSCEGGNPDIYCPLSGLPDVRTNLTDGNVELPNWLLQKWDSEGVRNQEINELNAFFNRTGYPRTPRYYLIKWLTDWVREFGFDGFRVDTVKHVEADVWKSLKEEATKALREWKANNPAKKPDDSDFWMTGEVFGQSINAGKNLFFNNGFDNIINFGFKGDVGGKSHEELFSDYARRLNSDPDFNVLNYIASHDVGPYDRNDLYYAGTTLLLAPGGAQIYYGDESGRPFFTPQTYSDAGYRAFMNWNDINNNQNTKNLLSHWQKLGQFRREHLSVGAGSHTKLSDSPYVFKRSYNKNGMIDNTIVVLNKDKNTNSFTTGVYGLFADGTLLKDYYSGCESTVANGEVTFNTAFGTLLIGQPFTGDAIYLNVTPESGLQTDCFEVTMDAKGPDSDIEIYYTTDGSVPDKSCTKYTASFEVCPDATIKAIAYADDKYSAVVTRKYYAGGPFNVYFKNTDNWEEVYIYLWDYKNNAPIEGWEWPGKLMVSCEYGNWYNHLINENVETGIIFNDGAGTQTGDLTRFYEGWYVWETSTWHDECPGDCNISKTPYLSADKMGGTYNSLITVELTATNNGVIYYTTDGTTPAQSPDYKYTDPIEISKNTQLKAIAYNSEGSSNIIDENYIIEENQEYTVYFNNTDNWNEVYIYLFDMEANAPIKGWKWPGKPMNKEGNTPWYSHAINASGDVGIVFNNNAGKQSKDLERNTDGWYHFSEDAWFDTCPGSCPGGNIEELTIYFNNQTSQWNSVYLYYWETTPEIASVSWPGVRMTDTDGDGWFEYTIYGAECANVIFSQNGNPQTGDLYVCDEGYYNNGWVDPVSFKSDKESITENSDLNIIAPYPNPVNNYINFRINKENTHVDIKLLSTSGQVLMNNKVYITDGTVQIPVDLQKGTYLLKIQCDNFLQTFKVLK